MQLAWTQAEHTQGANEELSAMRMIHVVGDSKWGGGGSIILALAAMARDMGWDVDFLATDPLCQEKARASGLRIIDLDVIHRDIQPLRDLTGLFALYRFFRQNRYDLVHTHTSKAGFVGRIAARLAGIPAVVHTAHSFSFHEESTWLERSVYVLLERIAARFCDTIVTVSNYHRAWALKLNIAEPSRIVAIPNGVADRPAIPTDTRARIRQACSVTPDELLILVAGRLAAGKGLEYLIDALPQVAAQTKKQFRVVLAGDGPLRSELETRVKAKQLDNIVTFLGFRDDVQDLLTACDAVAMPSLHEGMSMSLLEAMAAGKPIVASGIGSNLEVTADGLAAFIAPPKNCEALVGAIIALLENPEQAIGKARIARHLFEENYTVERMVSGYRGVYEELMARKRVETIGMPECVAEENVN